MRNYSSGEDMPAKNDLFKVNDWLWEIPENYRGDMKVPARVYASEKMLGEIFRDRSLEQLVNVATLPGIQKYALAMPDIHEGYGFPVGGVAAFDAENGIISPGGIGYDINCGVRLLRSEKTFKEIQPYLEKLGRTIYAAVPSGVGKGGRLVLKGKEFDEVLKGGAGRVVEMGYGEAEDLEHLESRGVLENADASLVSEIAKSRGRDQLGTMGAGNHFVEVEAVETIFDEEEAKRLGIFKDQVVILIHTGSRGLGHQIATDYIRVMMRAMPKYGISIPDRELACAPFDSPEGRNYFTGMKCGINMSFANRQVILHWIREVFSDVFGRSPEKLDMHMVYDVAHNTAKLERHILDGQVKNLLVHRKGATRAFGPGGEGLPECYREVGQPVIIGGSMETGSYLLVGTPGGEQTFFSTAHGSGRTMSRTKARKLWRGQNLQREMEDRGIYVRTASWSGLAEEAGGAYKNIDEVIEATEKAGISKRVVRFMPVGNVKG